MGKIRWQSYNVGPVIIAIILALIGSVVPSVRVILYVIALVIALWIGFMNIRHRQMDPEHAKRMQAIARYLDSMILANNINLSFNDGQSSSTINETCFRADFPALDPLLREWVTMPQVIGHKAQGAKSTIAAVAQSQWPTFAPVALGNYAFDYTKNNLTNPMPPGPAIVLAPLPKPSQLLQGTASGGTVLHTYSTGLTGPALVEAQKDEAAVQLWVTDMLKSSEVESWRSAVERQAELRNKFVSQASGD